MTDPVADPDRRAWHRAHATAAPDEQVAIEMMRSADRAQARGGLAAAAAFLQRAAELTPDRATRVERFLTAAGAKLEVADAAAASDLLAAAELGPVDLLQRARLERLRAKVIFLSRRGRDAPQPLLEAARRLASLDVGLARETYLEALSSAMLAGRLNRETSEREVALAAAGLGTPEPTDLVDLLLDGLVTRFTRGYADAVAPLSAALEMFRDEGRGAHVDQWLWLACRLAQELWNDELWFELATLGVNVARETGALALLPNALNHLAALNVHAGAFSTAAALGDEVRLLVGAVGVPPLDYSRYKLAATRGDRLAINALYESSIEGAVERGEGAAVAHHWALVALLHNGYGEYEQALAAATHGCEYDELMAYNGSLVERIEAAVRSGRNDVATDALDELTARARASGTAWALGVEARSHALLHDDEAAYLRSIELLGPTRAAVDLARSHLVYGEWLRREGRRKDAREQLQAAHDSFDRMGADAFAERTRRELVATGATARRVTADNRDALTPQELQVAQLARTGLTNPEIAARLYISPRTVEYHLGKVFRKLDVSTRRGLAAALDGSRHHAVQGYV